jgi:Homeodomain-like domain/DDE superfamily endonuclease
VAADLGVSRDTVRRWRGRFLRDRLEGLGDEPRPGAPRKITDEQVELVITKTLEERGLGADTHWSTRSMAAATGMSHGLELHLICDNYATQKTEAVKKWLLRHPRFHLHFTPTSSSWMNLVERWFAELTNRKLRRSAHRSVTEMSGLSWCAGRGCYAR